MRRSNISNDKAAPNTIGSRPLYAQVREILLERMSSGAWRPGELIPNEFEVARELGVSQGTVRKALDSLASDHLLIRRQGRGTYVAQHTPADMLFRFFNFRDPNGERIQPESRDVKLCEVCASEEERARLRLGKAAKVFRIRRIRTNDNKPFILETISLPASLFPGLASETDLPNTLYDHFQKVYGVTVTRGEERLTAATAGPEEAMALGAVEGAPLLKLDRVMYGLQNQPIEWRVGLSRMDGAAYVVELR